MPFSEGDRVTFVEVSPCGSSCDATVLSLTGGDAIVELDCGRREKVPVTSLQPIGGWPITILNTSVLAADGEYRLASITLDEAKALVVRPKGFESAIGHDSTAQILTELLGLDIRVNRMYFVQQPGQVALIFKLRRRLPEGRILSREEIESIGYTFKMLTRLS